VPNHPQDRRRHGPVRGSDLRERLRRRHNRGARGAPAVRRRDGELGRHGGGLRAGAGRHGHLDAGRRRDGRSVRRHQGGRRGLLRDRGTRPGRRPGDRRAQPGPPAGRRRGGAAGQGRIRHAAHEVMTGPAEVQAAVADAHRRGWALVLAATVRVTRDLDLAEECVQEAYAAALVAWTRDGVPRNPTGWLTLTARRRAIDALRRERVLRTKLPLLVLPEETADGFVEDAMRDTLVEQAEDAVPDDRLRLIFMCCHPALAREAQMALTLRLVCGVPTGDIARAFLVSETTMAARLTRAKKKISTARIPYRVPRAAELPARLDAVLGVIYLLFTLGHTAPAGTPLLRVDLVDRALHLARVLRELMPDEREVRGLLALLLVTDARRATRVDGHGRLLRLEEQDRSRWSRPALAEARDLVADCLRGGRPGRYTLQAAIACAYAEAPTFAQTDWQGILS